MMTRKRRVALRMVQLHAIRSETVWLGKEKIIVFFDRDNYSHRIAQGPYNWLLKKRLIRIMGIDAVEITNQGKASL